MAHHSRSTNNLSEHPLSIVSGIEMGALNRYTNIWPFGNTTAFCSFIASTC